MTVRVGVVGTSWWADGMHLPSLASHDGAVIAALCGRDRKRAEEMAARHGAKKVFTDWKTMLEANVLDAVIIAVPDELHHPIAMAALKRGLHVLCEKPLGLDARQAHEMYALSREKKRITMTYFTFRWLVQSEEMKRLVDEGFVGKIQYAHFAFLAGGSRGGWKENWRYDQRKANGALGDYGSHMIDMARWLCGEISTVSAHLATFTKPPHGADVSQANEAAILSVAFENGAQGTIRASNMELVRHDGFELHAEVCGDAGRMDLRVDMSGATLRGARNGDAESRELMIRPDILRDVDLRLGIVDQKRQIFRRRSSGVRGFI
ncbi:MAG: Gfo/Idh/MocA family oxidoreductase, partial [Candidatus Hydrogenedentota bacterium]